VHNSPVGETTGASLAFCMSVMHNASVGETTGATLAFCMSAGPVSPPPTRDLLDVRRWCAGGAGLDGD